MSQTRSLCTLLATEGVASAPCAGSICFLGNDGLLDIPAGSAVYQNPEHTGRDCPETFIFMISSACILTNLSLIHIYLSTTRRIRPAVPTPSHVPLSSTNCAERSRKNKEQKKPSYFIKHHDLSGICRMTLQPGFPIQIFHLSSGRRPYRFS